MATPQLQGTWTQYGLERLAQWLPGGEQLVIAVAALGDGNGQVPVVQPTQSALVREVWRGAVNRVYINPKDATDVIVDVLVPNNIGNFWAREWGLFDDTNGLVAVGPHDEMHKPVITQGAAAEFLERFHLPVSNTDVIYLTIGTQALATVEYVDTEIEEHNTDPVAHGGALIHAAYAWMLSTSCDLIMSKATGTDTLDVSRGYQGMTVLPAETTFAQNSERELIMQLPA